MTFWYLVESLGPHLSAEETEVERGMWHTEVTQTAEAPTVSFPGNLQSCLWNFLPSHRMAWVRGQIVRCCCHTSGILGLLRGFMDRAHRTCSKTYVSRFGPWLGHFRNRYFLFDDNVLKGRISGCLGEYWQFSKVCFGNVNSSFCAIPVSL